MADWTSEFVLVKNETESEIEWDGRKYAAGSQTTVPYVNMVNTFGDPRSTLGGHQIFLAGNGERGVIQPREIERNRVMSYWQDANNPRPTFYSMDGERLWTVAEDPSGDHVMPASMSVDQQAALQQTVARQQQIIERLLEVSGLDKDALPTALPPNIPTDDSTASDTQSPFAHSTDDIPLIEE